MVVSKALRATGCASCRQSLLRSFTSLATSPIRGPTATSRFPKPRVSVQRQQSSRLTSGSERWEDDIEESKRPRIVEEDGIDEEYEHLEEEEDLSEERQVSAVPWYLQVDSPRRAPQPLSERQKIPELPETPPPILQPLLEQVSVDLGLDDLSLLDLRKLDPPPALGANLLMLIGTARSEKHLHVSADRLCRWLRSTYKLRPDADGLLGRNELKLKLRRKAKRAKLMGSSVDANEDDGVRTGWVCVDVGVVDGAKGEAVAPPKQDFVGFGRRTDGVRIVVQMMTEEKREEIELEKLWSGILQRGVQPEIEGTEEGAESLSSETHEALSEPTLRMVPTGPSSILGQTRGLHTSARRLSTEAEKHQTSPAFTPDEFVQPDVNSMKDRLTTFMYSGRHEEAMNILIQFSQRVPPELDIIREAGMRYIAAQNYDQATNVLFQISHHIPQLQNGRWKLLLLELLRTFLERQKPSEALLHLGEHEQGTEPTPFMKCFNGCLSLYPTQFEAESRIWLAAYARGIGHHAYPMSQLASLFDELQLAGVKISRPAYMYMLNSLLRPESPDGGSPTVSYRALDKGMKILQTMYDQGLDILDEDMLVELQEAIGSAGPPPDAEISPSRIVQNPRDTCDLRSLPMSPIGRRLHVLSKTVDLPLFSEESRMRLIDLHARNKNWLEFWDVFAMANRRGQPNSASMYAFMFGTVAQTRNRKACMNVLRNWAPRMEQEQPPVAYEGDVAEAVKACLKIADPYIAQTALESPNLEGEWLTLWRKCSWSKGKDPFIYG